MQIAHAQHSRLVCRLTYTNPSDWHLLTGFAGFFVGLICVAQCACWSCIHCSFFLWTCEKQHLW